jgi:hypothetical protein
MELEPGIKRIIIALVALTYLFLLVALAFGQSVTHKLSWPKGAGFVIERSFDKKSWTEITRPTSGATTYSDKFTPDPRWREVCYRIGGLNLDGVVFGKLQCIPLPPLIKVAPASVKPGQSVTVTWGNIPTPAATDFFQLFNASGAGLLWFYVNCTATASTGRASGKCSFALPTNTVKGQYQFRLFAEGKPSPIAVSNSLGVL